MRWFLVRVSGGFCQGVGHVAVSQRSNGRTCFEADSRAVESILLNAAHGTAAGFPESNTIQQKVKATAAKTEDSRFIT